MTQQEIGTHASHCCILHGCKYGESECPVVNKTVIQKYICHDCEIDGISSLDELHVRSNTTETVSYDRSIIGVDSHGNSLSVGDRCKYRIDGKEMSGEIIYDQEEFAFSFKQDQPDFPLVLMSKAYDIELIV